MYIYKKILWIKIWKSNKDNFLIINLFVEHDSELQLRLENQAVNQPAVICYTSGTTANPKGVLLSQDNLTWTCISAKEAFQIGFGNDDIISYLPLSHIGEF